MNLVNPFVLAVPFVNPYPKYIDWTGLTGFMTADKPGGLSAGNNSWTDTAYSIDEATTGQTIEISHADVDMAYGNRILGLQTTSLVGSTAFNQVPYSCFRYLTDLYAYASGSLTLISSCSPGDVYSVKFDGTDVKIYQNGVLKHTWAGASLSYPVRAMAFMEIGLMREATVNIT